MRINTQVIMEETDLSTIATSDTIELDHIYGFSILVKYTGSDKTMDATAYLEISNNGTDWSTYHTFTLEGLSDNCTINATDVFYKMARVRIVSGRGTVSPTLTVYKKGA